MWRAALARRGEVIQFSMTGSPGWGYLAVAGGIDVPPVMGTRSTYLRGGFGGLDGRVLLPGDHLPVTGELPPGWQSLAGRHIPLDLRPPYAAQVSLPVILGPQADAFSEAGLRTFLSTEFGVSPTSDRMGYRLAGSPVEHRGGADLLSEGIAAGAVQVPADGQPIVMMSDRPATGGYPKIATLARVGLPLLAQALPGVGQVRFHTIRVEEAQAQYRRLVGGIEEGLRGDEDGFEL